ncbi:hypothetical protein ACFXKD_26640 [Nocardiopsis aegyptia]|uniref:hypothetical protein n=1 Tax=Nocardiopsis aegyptia TaxID=220378 RepID=UPI00367030A0
MARGARVWRAALAGAAGFLAVGCASDGWVAAEDLPAEITCNTFYRPDAGSGVGQEKVTVTVERHDGVPGAEESVEFDTMGLSVTYVGDAPEGRVVWVVVTGEEGEELATQLYQFGVPPPQDISFIGNHGFTGLAYVTHGDAQLQYWCVASD